MSRPDLSRNELLDAYGDGRRDFHGLYLDGIDLSEVTLEHLWFEQSSLVGADFSAARLPHVDFARANLAGATFRGASLADANLFLTEFHGADLRDASLADAYLAGTECLEADMRKTYLGGATFEDATLTGSKFDDAILGSTSLFELDVSAICDASFVFHEGPSWIDTRTVMKSYRHPRLKALMVESGVPDLFAEYMIECARALGDDVLQGLMQSTFISYGAPDEAFARRLYDALRANGVVTFFFPETARVGERIGDEVFNALQRHDRMVLLCSQGSLDRPGVLNEIQETLDREARDGGATYLIPVMLDDYLLEDWNRTQPDLAERVRRRVAADFRGTENDSAKFDAALSRLLAALRKKNPAR